MKKWLIFILLLTTTVGTFFPCCATDDCQGGKILSNTTDHDNKKEGNCSPFFACATCPGFVEVLKPIQLPQPLVEKQVHHEHLVKFNLATYASSFWQPPRFS